MITKVNGDLEKAFWEYVSHEERINLFIIGDVENYGLETDFQEIWLQMCDGRIVSVMLKYYKSLVIYSYENDFDIDEMISHIQTLDVKEISGKKSVIQRLLNKYDDFTEYKENSFCSLRSLNKIDSCDMENYTIEKAEIKDLENISIFLNKIKNLKIHDFIKSKTKQLKDKTGRIYFIKENNEIVSSISTGVETSFLAMICSLATAKEHRKKGLATYIAYILSKQLVNEGKIPCLFYNDEFSEKIYDKIGFKKDYDWSILLKH